MSDNQRSIYRQEADAYEALVSREDYQGNILKVVREISPYEGRDVLDLGAGTGRLSLLLGTGAASIRTLDLSPAMLMVARRRLLASGQTHWLTAAADHRALPLPAASADLIVSGWSVCYIKVWNPESWHAGLERALDEMRRVLRPGGRIVILETLGTGYESPHVHEHLAEYFEFLEIHGFASDWFRTDYCFDSLEQAVELSGFFFGDEMAEQVRRNHWTILPECTGVWWKEV